jgi:hypothetical protein
MITLNEWGCLVKTILPSLETAAEEHGLFLNSEAATRLLDEGEYLTVYHMVRGVCDGLQLIPTAVLTYGDLCSLIEKYPHEDAH